MSSPRTFQVLTLNIWNRGGPWDERLRVIRAGLAAMQPDVVCLQEVLSLPDFDQAAMIAEGAGYHIAFGADGDDHYPFGNAVLSRWPITRTVARPLPRGGTESGQRLAAQLPRQVRRRAGGRYPLASGGRTPAWRT